MRQKGKVTSWKDDRGFGFVTPIGGGEQVFVHVRSFSNRRRRPVGGEVVFFEPVTDTRGRTRAEKVTFSDERAVRAASPRRGGRLLPLSFAVLFLVFVAASTRSGSLPLPVLGLYLATSVLAFIVYWIDKSAARAGGWRTSESTLHLFGLLGGWPGALAARHLLRHKSIKPSFRVVFWITVAANCAALGWLLSVDGARALRSIVDRM